MAEQRPVILNYGGGRQSVAICVLIAQGALPMPDRIVMARVAREYPRTFEYLDAHTQPLLARVGAKVEVIDPDSRVPGDYYQYADGSLGTTPLTPGWTATQGRLPALCSGHWKRDLIHRWLRAQGYGPKRPIEQWIGFSVEERRRAKGASRVQWIRLGYPLLTRVPLRAEHCVRIVERAGLPLPKKSRCYDCANQSSADWREMRDEDPELFQLAVRRDHALRLRDPEHNLYLHHGGVPLDQASLEDRDDDTGSLWSGGCNAAGCYT
jgi:hypothetical protein